jgi:hypothetical protein
MMKISGFGPAQMAAVTDGINLQRHGGDVPKQRNQWLLCKWLKRAYWLRIWVLSAGTRMLSVDDLFKGRHFDREIIILRVRWYLRFKLSFRDLVR